MNKLFNKDGSLKKGVAVGVFTIKKAKKKKNQKGLTNAK